MHNWKNKKQVEQNINESSKEQEPGNKVETPQPTAGEQPSTEQRHFPEDTHAPHTPSTINDQPRTNMEVHKHPHHVTHKKKWGEYLLEFFMLFLAVFLGFLAENLRESQVE